MNFGTDEHAWFSTMLDGMGKAKGLEFMKGLAKQQLHFPGSSSVMRVQLMLGGESAMVIAARGRRVTELKEKGAPIDYRILDPYPAEPSSLAIMRRASHPHGAILFADWLMFGRRSDIYGAANSTHDATQGHKTNPTLSRVVQKGICFCQSCLAGSKSKRGDSELSADIQRPLS